MGVASGQIDREEDCGLIPIGNPTIIKAALTRNIGRDTAARIGYLLTRVLIPPFVLSHLGLPVYSVWAAMFIMVSYVGVTTMGVSAVYIKYTAEFGARGEAE